MKISFRILLVNFIVVAVVVIGSTLAFFSLTNKLISFQHTKFLLSSSNDFVFSFQQALQGMDDDLHEMLIKKKDLSGSNLDFFFKVLNDSIISLDECYYNHDLISQSNFESLEQFKKYYPGIIIKKYISKDGTAIYYGKVLDKLFINSLSKKIRADIAILNGNIPIEISNSEENQNYFSNIIKASKTIIPKNYELFHEKTEQADFYAAYYTSKDFHLSDNIGFIIFSTLPEAAELRKNINSLLLIIGFAGVALSLILAMIFTDKIRKQITILSKTAENIKEGDLSKRVNISSADELGQLGQTFNTMLDEIQRKENSINEYSEFIALINKNPTLDEVAEAALTKIIKTADLAAGKISLVEAGKIIPICTQGLIKENPDVNNELYRRVIDKCETTELSFNGDGPQINSGLIAITIKHIIIFPIIYNKSVIAILELASVSQPGSLVKEYFSNIKEQLAIGFTNALALRQLENLVIELKNLNEEYHKQNQQISAQNKKLTDLHEQLHQKAEELEVQKEKAVQAAKIKAQFLANVSHELKTPLNSILGLTELLLNDRNLPPAQRERLSVVLRNSNKLAMFINDILSFSRIEAGKLQLQKNNFVLSDLITELDLQISPLVKEKKIDLVIFNETDKNIIINTDQNKLQQILVNLLSNAVKFTERGFVKLKIKNEANNLLCEVEDSGIGIAEGDIKYIFDEFRQVDGTSSRRHNGTGLGLAICEKYTRLLGGEIYCESKPGIGSTFHLVIPVDITINQEASMQSTGSKPIAIILENADNNRVIEKFLLSRYDVIFYDINSFSTQVFDMNPAICLFNINLFLYDWSKFYSLLQTANCPLVIYYNSPNSESFYILPGSEIMLNPFTPDKLFSTISNIERHSGANISNILYIDSDVYRLKEIKAEMKNARFYFSLADNEQTALETVNQASPDVILVNLCSPAFDCFNLLSRIRELTHFENTPVIALFNSEMSKEELVKFYFRLNNVVSRKNSGNMNILKVINEKINLLEGRPADRNLSIIIDSDFEKLLNNGDSKLQDKKNLIMIVDDDSDTLYTVSEIIREAGFETILARNGVECLTKLRNVTPRLILLDIMMPQMDGFETIKRIRADNNIKDLTVFALTAKAMFGESEIIIKNGFDDFIPKPLEVEKLILKIKSVMTKTVVQ